MAEKTHNAELGELGENMAVEYLLGKGYKILERNWRFGHKEIDIIARDTEKNELVMVEVKTRKGKSMLLPGDLIPLSKQRFLINAADAYIRWHAVQTDTRFDVILIYVQHNGEHTLQHIPEAFYPTL
ncbi:MAG: YraN family protein [Bacteroidales bacterium]|nr:YraN family protein [Bacteroidales bacterium]